MKVTVVPAQVTTVEDRIIGNLGFSQMLLLIVPVFVGGALFALLPPVMESAVYKYITMGFIALVCCILAIRIRGKILAAWLVTILRFNLRPRYYLFNKNTTGLRQDYAQVIKSADKTQTTSKRERVRLPRLGTAETIKVLAAIENPASRLRFETTRKGGLSVRLTEIEE